MKPLWLFVGLALVLAAVAVVAAFLSREARELIRPADYRHPLPTGFRYKRTPKSAYGLHYEDVEFDIASGRKLRGWMVPAAAEACPDVFVLVHGRSGDRTSMDFLLPWLFELGMAIVAVDLLENGLSDGSGRGTGLGVAEADELQAIVAQLSARGFRNIAVAGGSLGGTAAILAAARDRRIAAVLADGPVASMQLFQADRLKQRLSRLGLDMASLRSVTAEAVVRLAARDRGVQDVTEARSVIARIAPRPMLLIYGSEDTATGARHAHELMAAAGKNVDELMIAGAGHGNGHEIAPHLYKAKLSDLVQRMRLASSTAENVPAACTQSSGRSTQ